MLAAVRSMQFCPVRLLAAGYVSVDARNGISCRDTALLSPDNGHAPIGLQASGKKLGLSCALDCSYYYWYEPGMHRLVVLPPPAGSHVRD